MTNPINGNKASLDRPLGESLRSQSNSKVDSQPGGQRESGKADEVQGIQSERLQALMAGIKETPDVNMERVEALRQSIADGNYPIDADRIASRFMELERMLES